MRDQHELIARAQPERFRETALRVCAPSDLVILKAFANRPHDWTDIRGVMVRSAALLDWPLIDKQIAVLAELKKEPEIIVQLSALRKSLPPSL